MSEYPQSVIWSIDPSSAHNILETMGYDHQRNIRQYHVRELAKLMEKGEFQPGTQIKIGVFNGQSYLLNGQHRLRAVILSNKSQMFSVLTSEYETSEELAYAYGAEDNGLKRTAGDMYRALELNTKLGLTQTDITKMSAAIAFMATGCTAQKTFRDTPISRMDVPTIIGIYAPYMLEFRKSTWEPAFGIGESIVRASSLSVALLTYRYAVPKFGLEMVHEFWNGVAQDDGLMKGDPRKFASNHIRTVRHAVNSKVVSKLGTPAASARYLTACFTSFVNGDRNRSVIHAAAPSDPLAFPSLPKNVVDWLV